MRRLAASRKPKGVGVHRSRVVKLKITGDRTHLSGPDLDLTAETVVIAAGAFSRELALQAGDRIPLETERGYHLEYATESPLLQRPVCPTHLGFYMTPMAGRLRVAGTVELGGTSAGPNQSRFELLDREVPAVFPGIGQGFIEVAGFQAVSVEFAAGHWTEPQ